MFQSAVTVLLEYTNLIPSQGALNTIFTVLSQIPLCTMQNNYAEFLRINAQRQCWHYAQRFAYLLCPKLCWHNNTGLYQYTDTERDTASTAAFKTECDMGYTRSPYQTGRQVAYICPHHYCRGVCKHMNFKTTVLITQQNSISSFHSSGMFLTAVINCTKPKEGKIVSQYQ